VVKLADRLHNMRTLQYMPPEKQVSIARETLEIFAPLAHRLGMWSFRSELADLSFKYLFPSEHANIESFVAEKMRAYEATLSAATAELAERLGKDPRLSGSLGGSFTLTGRTKSLHSTWKKLERDGCPIDKINDLVALRIVIDVPPEASSEAEDASICYHVLGQVHGAWTPLPRTLKDYISSPKPNGYRSLHTTVLVGTQPLEVQIRTQAMHHIAEYGAAAHWAYKEEGEDRRPPGGAWLQISSRSFSRSITKWGEEYDCAHEFMQLVRQELLGTRVFVFVGTENGRSTRILNLPVGATVGDVVPLLPGDASTHVPLVSGLPASVITELRNGDIISSAPRNTAAPELAPIIDPLTLPEQVGVLEAGQLRVDDGSEIAANWHVCERCLPLPCDNLVCTSPANAQPDGDGRVSCTLHRADSECHALRRQLAAGDRGIRPTPALGDKYRDKLGAALGRVRDGGESAREAIYKTKVIVFTKDRPGVLLTVSACVTSETVNIVDVHSKTHKVGGESAFQYKVHIASFEQLERLTAALEELDDVQCVLRGDMEDMLHDSPTSFWAHARS
jgi:(p)ppGpp synthase/HD superfamily hydrolase